MSEPRKPDPDLVEYLRTHLKRYGAETLRRRLAEEGVEEEEIEAALAETIRRPGAGRLLKPILVLGGSAAAILAITVLYSSQNAPVPATAPARAPAGPSVDASTATAAAEARRPFIGHSGYVLELPPRYAAIADFKDPEKTLEVVYIFPKGTDPANFVNEGIYSQLGILRLEVSPRRIPEGRIGMEAIRDGVVRTLKKGKAPYTTRETRVGGLSALIVTIGGAFPLAQAWVLGAKEMYLLTGGAEDALFTNVLESLREVSQ